MISFQEWIAPFGAEAAFVYCRKGGVPPADRIVIWEDQWEYRQEIVRSRVLSKLGLLERIPGRLCTVQRISRPVADEFLEANHLQGTTASKIKYGLFLPEKYFRVLKERPPGIDSALPLSGKGQEGSRSSFGAGLLMAVMTFSGPRLFHDGTRSYELIRFAVRCNFHVQGGFSRLLQHFIREKDPDSIMTYVDLDWYTGSTYENLGFEPTGVLPPISYTVDETGKRKPVVGDLNAGGTATGDLTSGELASQDPAYGMASWPLLHRDSPPTEEPIPGESFSGEEAAGKPASGEPASGARASGARASERPSSPQYDVINKGSLKMVWKKKLQ